MEKIDKVRWGEGLADCSILLELIWNILLFSKCIWNAKKSLVSIHVYCNVLLFDCIIFSLVFNPQHHSHLLPLRLIAGPKQSGISPDYKVLHWQGWGTVKVREMRNSWASYLYTIIVGVRSIPNELTALGRSQLEHQGCSLMCCHNPGCIGTCQTLPSH